MTVVTSYPGIYIEEDATPAISVSNSPTAVPVFVGSFSKADGTSFPAYECVEVANWLAFTSLNIRTTRNVAVVITSTKGTGDSYTYTESVTPGDWPSFSYGVSMYFQNGGGRCYLLPIGTDKTKDSSIATAIQEYPDITLLVPLSDAWATGREDSVRSSLNTLLVDGNNYFLITEIDDTLALPTTTAELTAAYYPYAVVGSSGARPSDANIPVTGYVDSASTSVTSMADLKTVNATLYQEAVDDIDPLFVASQSLTLASAMAGVYCATDRSRGVWKAPANVPIAGVQQLSKVLTDADQGSLNDRGVNAIRSFQDRGVVPWGCRTLAGTSAASDTKWRYIPVRRLFNSAEADIKQAMQAMMFEPNYQPTWEKVRHAIDNYLYQLWRQGALAGTSPEEAYFVQIGKGITMSDADIAAGKMIAKVGMAAARPAEFIILQFTQEMSL